MDFLEPSVMAGRGGRGHEIIMKFGTGVKLDVFYKKVCDITTITS